MLKIARAYLFLTPYVLLLYLLPQAGLATTLSGVAIYASDEAGEPVGPFWHTSLDPSGRPIGFTRWLPTGLRGIPFLNDAQGEIQVDLIAMSHITTTFWQYNLGEFSLWMVLNLFFNGDNLNPGISALVPFDRGFTLFTTNPNPVALSLYGREAQNPQALIYDDGSSSARLGVAFYFRSGDPRDQWMWRPSDLTNLDRVGTTQLAPDGQWDGILVFELVVGPSQQQPTPGQGPVSNPGSIAAPLTANVGEDLWVPPEDKPPLEEEAGAGTAADSGEQHATEAAGVATAGHQTPAAGDTPGPETTPDVLPTNATPPPPTPAPTFERGAPPPSRSRSPQRTPTKRTDSTLAGGTPTPGKRGWLW